MLRSATRAWRRTQGAGRREFLMGSAALTTAFALYLVNSGNNGPFYRKFVLLDEKEPPLAPDTSKFARVPTRAENLQRLKDESIIWDMLIVGGGATGAGCALDATTRGLKVAAVEREDFASGTSSKSTKLVHGGVRYLEKAVWNLDYEQYKLVREALRERKTFLEIAPHLTESVPIMIPVYKWWQVPYFWMGTKFYDLLAWGENLEPSYFMSRRHTIAKFPMIQSENLKGALVYYDGQHNDARMNVELMTTAACHGAAIANRVEVMAITKDEQSQINGARVMDKLTGEQWNVRAKCVVNATGPYTDSLRKMDDPNACSIVAPSTGVHVVLPGYYSPKDMGLIGMNTSDGRVMFYIPFMSGTIAGTTDAPCKIRQDPLPTEQEVSFILKEIKRYLSDDLDIRRCDVMSAWSGIRPLVYDPAAKNTESLVRNHMINVSDSGLLTIAGGKWTTYREMAEQTVDCAIKHFNLQPREKCVTKYISLLGGRQWQPMQHIALIHEFGVSSDVAENLCNEYGSRAWLVANYIEPSQTGSRELARRLDSNYPFLEAEVRYCAQHEYANSATDILGRRTRLAFLDALAALRSLPRVIDIMAEELNWNEMRKDLEWSEGVKYLLSMGLPASNANITRDQVEAGTAVRLSDDYQLFSDESVQPQLTVN